MTFKLIWPTRSRTGSQFVVKLTRSLFGSMLGKVALINGARRDTTQDENTIGVFAEMLAQGRGTEYVQANGIAAMKYEDPGKDDFVLDLLEAYPEAKAVTSYRKIEDVIISHHSIRHWGHREADVIYQFSASLHLYRRLFERGRLYMVNVDDPAGFDLELFARFIGAPVTRSAREIVTGWEPVNTLSYQQEKHDGGQHGRHLPPRIERLREIHPWIEGIEREYLAMCNRVGG